MNYQKFTYKDIPDSLNDRQKEAYNVYAKKMGKPALSAISEDGRYLIVESGQSHDIDDAHDWQTFDFIIDKSFHSLYLITVGAFKDDEECFNHTLRLISADSLTNQQQDILDAFQWKEKYGIELARAIESLSFSRKIRVSIVI